MPQVRCPQCGAINDTRGIYYPFCIGCQDNLAKCGYCRWFNDQAIVCIQPAVAGMFEVAPEATPPCAYHVPREDVRVQRKGHWIWAVTGLVAAIFVLVYALIKVIAPIIPPQLPEPVLQFKVESDDRNAVVGQPYTVRVDIYNNSEVLAKDVRFEIERIFFSKFELHSVKPEPSVWKQMGWWEELSFPDIYPRKRYTIRLEVAPKAHGAYHFAVRLVSGKNFYHGLVDLPIVVSKPQGEPKA